MEDYSSMKHSDFIPDRFDLSIQRERERGKRCTRLGAQAMVSHTRLLDTTGTARIGRFLDCIICCTKSIINLAQNLSWGEAEMEEEDAT